MGACLATLLDCGSDRYHTPADVAFFLRAIVLGAGIVALVALTSGCSPRCAGVVLFGKCHELAAAEPVVAEPWHPAVAAIVDVCLQ